MSTIRKVEVQLTFLKGVDSRVPPKVRLRVEDYQTGDEYIEVDLTAEQFTAALGASTVVVETEVNDEPLDWWSGDGD